MVVACRILSCSTWGRFLTRDWTRASCIGSVESQPLDHRGSLNNFKIIHHYSKHCYAFCRLCPAPGNAHMSSAVSDPCNPMGCSLPGSSVHGISQARMLAWVPIPWEIPQTEEPGRLQSTRSQRVGHNWSDWAHTHTYSIAFPGCSVLSQQKAWVENHCLILNPAAVNVEGNAVLSL